MTSLSVVIPSYNSAATLRGCLKALEAQLDWNRDEIIVVDSSSDSSSDSLRALFPQIRWQQHGQRLLPGAARNRGFQIAQRERVAFLDADIVVQQGWRKAADDLPSQAVAAGGPIEPGYPHNRWGLARYWIEFGEFSTASLPREIWNIPSCNMIWLRSAFAETGGFPENFASADDLLFNYRNMKLKSRRFSLHRQLKVFHPADCGLHAAEQHLRHVGYWSGRARGEGLRPGVGNSRLSAPFLYVYRFSQTWRRCIRGSGLAEARSLAPSIAKGVGWWCEGFYQGLGE
ncbi:MAG TPA: glycosyltransferase [Acidobacteriota bacterium]|jgi:glycosyltransferase involved in cell wall biosynthesis